MASWTLLTTHHESFLPWPLHLPFPNPHSHSLSTPSCTHSRQARQTRSLSTVHSLVGMHNRQVKIKLMGNFFFFAVSGFALRAYTLSYSISPFL
jgi:hypothetical protein